MNTRFARMAGALLLFLGIGGKTFAAAPQGGAPDASTLKAFALVLGDDEAARATAKLTRIDLGRINLPSGRIIAADGLTIEADHASYLQAVAPGEYRVRLHVVDDPDWGKRVAVAELRFAEGMVARWANALVEGNDPSAEEGQLFGFVVDAGVASFMSVEARDAYMKDMETAEAEIEDFTDFYTDVIAAAFGDTRPSAAIYTVKADTTQKIALFESGLGDGTYPSYFGYDAEGKPLVLMTTFFVIEED